MSSLADSLKMQEIAYEQISDNFWYAAYGVFKVVMMKDCGFINATKLCSLGNKNLYDWCANKNSKNLLQALACKFGDAEELEESCFVVKYVRNAHQTDVEKEISGTYYHPTIIPHIACWISVDFALRVGDIVNDFIIGEYKRCLEVERSARRSAEMDVVKEREYRHFVSELLNVTEKQNEIYQCELKKVDEEKDLLEERLESERQLKHQELANKEAEIACKSAELAVAGLNLVESKEQLKESRSVLNKSRVDLALWACTHSFTILKVNDAAARGPYYAIRRKRSDMNRTVNNFQKKFPNAVIVYQQKYIPNGVNLYQRLKVNRVIDTHQNYFKLNSCEHDLVRKIDFMNGNTIRAPIVNYT